MRSKEQVLQAIAELEEDASALVEGPNAERAYRIRREDLVNELAQIEQAAKERDTPRCGNCIYFALDAEPYQPDSSTYGRCRRESPKLAYRISGWPPTNAWEWCGEWLGADLGMIDRAADELELRGMPEAAGLLRKFLHKKPGGRE